MLQNKKRQFGFTLVELLVVIAIIGILSTLAIVALGNVRSKARDTKRVADLKQISTALELYYADYGSYPTIITPGQSIVSPDGARTYMATIPNNPVPRNDGNCPDSNYGYIYTTSTNSYYLYSCTNSTVGDLVAGAVTARPYSPITNEPLAGLTGWWKLDETSGTTAVDSSGGGHDGSIVGSMSWVDAKNGKGLWTNGSDGTNYISMGDVLDMGTGDYTMSTWAKMEHMTDNYGNIISKGSPNDTGMGWMIHLSGGGASDIAVAYISFGSALQLIGTYTIPDNTWHLYSLSIARNSFAVFYVDGVEVSRSNISTNSAVNMQNAYNVIGMNYPGWTSKGTIDDMRIYNRALSAAEISALYNATK